MRFGCCIFSYISISLGSDHALSVTNDLNDLSLQFVWFMEKSPFWVCNIKISHFPFQFFTLSHFFGCEGKVCIWTQQCGDLKQQDLTTNALDNFTGGNFQTKFRDFANFRLNCESLLAWKTWIEVEFFF